MFWNFQWVQVHVLKKKLFFNEILIIFMFFWFVSILQCLLNFLKGFWRIDFFNNKGFCREPFKNKGVFIIWTFVKDENSCRRRIQEYRVLYNNKSFWKTDCINNEDHWLRNKNLSVFSLLLLFVLSYDSNFFAITVDIFELFCCPIKLFSAVSFILF